MADRPDGYLSASEREVAASSILDAHPDAAIAAADPVGLLVALPDELATTGREILDGVGAIEYIHAEDRIAMLRAWEECTQVGAAHVVAELTSGETGTFHFFDLRERYGVHLIALVRSELPNRRREETGSGLGPLAPRLAVTVRDELASFVAIDEAGTAMLGWTIDDLRTAVGLELIHPDDRDRALQNWVEMLTDPAVPHRWRGRHLRKDGSWLWIEFTTHNELAEHGGVRSELYDISGEMAAVDALEDRERLLREVAEALPVGVVRLDLDGRAVYANQRSLDLLRAPAVSSIDDVLACVIEPDRSGLAEAFAAVIARRGDRAVQLRVDPGAAGSERHLECRVHRLRGRTADREEDAMVTIADITDAVTLSRELERRANVDSLTGAMSRGATLAHLETTEPGATIVYFDVDRFKDVNDRYGHAAGDAVLRSIVDNVRRVIGDDGSIGRLGGDEFLVIVPGVRDDAGSLALAAAIGAAADHIARFDDAAVPVRVSIGVARTTTGTRDVEALVGQADDAMYRAKQAGRGEPVLASQPTGGDATA